MRAYRPAVMKKAGQFNAQVDRNLFLSEEDKNKFAERGWDRNSVGGDPMFVDPANLDFRVKDGSPAFEVGFENFSMDQFGVQKPELKAIARTPEVDLPTLSLGGTEDKPKSMKWMGATLRPLKGEEFSAFGVSEEEGGLHLEEVPEDSPADKAGFKQGDVLQKINGRPVKTVEDLKWSAERMIVQIVRQQAAIEMRVSDLN
jgi:membrane-associated protease RseP (regulator of RpoE activity)